MKIRKEEIKKISQKSKVSEKIILFYLKNKGYIEDVFEGIVINKEDYFNKEEIILLENIKLKENVIKNN